jgi:threonine dehydrogenase-like Zn-dependent dehydrogenase
MRALTVIPGKADSAELVDLPEPPPEPGTLLVEGLALGVCGTDLDIVRGEYGWAPEGRERLVLGHESLGRVLEAPDGSGFRAGDLAVGIVRHPDPVPCPNCAVGEWDMCRNGQYTEHGIKQRDGFGAERYRLDPAFAVKLDAGLETVGMLLEPATILAKAWEHIEAIGRRALWEPRRALVTGAGPIGLLAALMGVARGLEVHVLDRATGGPKPGLVRDLGATYFNGPVSELCREADVIVECTGVGELVLEAMSCSAPGAVVCLTGVSSGKHTLRVDAAALNRRMVLENDVVFGSVNANRRHYEAAARALARADRAWLERLITRRVPFERWSEALTRRPDDVKPVIDLTA